MGWATGGSSSKRLSNQHYNWHLLWYPRTIKQIDKRCQCLSLPQLISCHWDLSLTKICIFWYPDFSYVSTTWYTQHVMYFVLPSSSPVWKTDNCHLDLSLSNIYLINNLFPVLYFPIKAQVYSSSGRITIRFTMYMFAGPLDPSLFLYIQVIKCKIDHSVWRCIRNCNQTPTILPNLHLGLTCHLASSLSACAHEGLVAPSSACRHHTPHLRRKRTFNL